MKDLESFKRHWDSFRVGLKGGLTKKSRNHTLTYNMAKLMLEDAKMDWTSSTSAAGKWLAKFSELNPASGELLRSVIEKDMHFDEPASMRNVSSIANLGISAAGAVVGFSVSRLVGAGAFASVLSTVIPAVVLYPSVNAVRNIVAKKNDEQLVEDYMSQLDKYYKSILSILEDVD